MEEKKGMSKNARKRQRKKQKETVIENESTKMNFCHDKCEDGKDRSQINVTLSKLSSYNSGSSSDVNSKSSNECISSSSNECISSSKIKDEFLPSAQPEKGSLVRAHRLEYGKDGYKIDIITNFFTLSVKSKCVYHYDIDIVSLDRKFKKKDLEGGNTENSRRIGKELCRSIISKLIKSNAVFQTFHPVYDGRKNLFTHKPLPIKSEKSFEVCIPIDDKVREYAVVIKPVLKNGSNNNIVSFETLPHYLAGKTDKIPEDIRMIFETILLHRDPPFFQMNIGRSFFSKAKPVKYDIGCGADVLMGYNQTVRFTEKGPAIVINLSASAFHKSVNVVEYIADVLHMQRIDERTRLKKSDIDKLNKLLSGVRVEVTHMSYKRKYPIKEFINESTREKVISLSENNCENKMTVEDYFIKQYGLKLKYPNLSCLHMRTTNNKVFMPPELCHVVEGQRIKGKLNSMQTANMIRKTAVKPDLRFEKILQHADTVSSCSSKYLTFFGLQMSLDPREVSGRVLAAPSLQYNRNNEKSVVNPNEKGIWDMRYQNFSVAVRVNYWMLLSFVDQKVCSLDDLRDFCVQLKRSGQRAGVNMGNFDVLPCQEPVENALEAAKRKNAEMVVIVLESQNSPLYDVIKYFADLKFQMITQCVAKNQILAQPNRRDQIFTNLLLKINTKLGGINHILYKRPVLLEESVTIIFGADAVHPIKGSLSPSIAAVVGCTDERDLFKYAARCRAQRNAITSRESQEIIVDLHIMVKEILIEFFRNTKKKPQKILFFRDGVSEGQFQHALDIEVKEIKKACSLLGNEYKPSLTFIVVQKRHQFVAKPKYQKNGVGRGGNLPPGTVIDTDIVDPYNFDYYLCSHEGIQGTSKPAHYTVLYDENRMKSDEVQSLCYYLCHMYARCNRSISIPAPVKYADLLAYRVSKYVDYLIKKKYPVVSSKKFAPVEIPGEIPDEIISLVESVKTCNPMFFL